MSSVVLKYKFVQVAVLVKFLLVFILFFESSLFFLWMVLSITLLQFWVVLPTELSLQVIYVLVWFTMVLISVSCFIINVFAQNFFSEVLYFFFERAHVGSMFYLWVHLVLVHHFLTSFSAKNAFVRRLNSSTSSFLKD